MFVDPIEIAPRSFKQIPIFRHDDSYSLHWPMRPLMVSWQTLTKWNLPPEVCSAIQFHHSPTAEAADSFQRSAATICLGDWVAHHLNEPDPSLTREHGLSVCLLELRGESIKPIFARTQKGLERVKGLLDM